MGDETNHLKARERLHGLEAFRIADLAPVADV